MAILSILCYPDPRLHTVAKPVQVVDDRVRRIVADMLETMYDAHGIGLAATQVDVHERIVVIATVRVRALDAQGQERTIEADELLAVCIQHELDHLLGKVFVEYLSPLKRNRIKSKMLKRQREARA